jgi:O-antigen/teichoic acid export membrane protein
LLAALFWSASFIIFAIVLYLLQKKEIGKRIIPTIKVLKWKRNIKESYHFGLNGILGMAYQFIPLFLLSYFSSMKTVGSFSLMYKLTFAICGLAYYLPSVFYPRLSRSIIIDFNQFKRLQKILLGLMIVASCFFLVVAFFGKQQFIHYFDSSKYSDLAEMYDIFSILVIAYLIRFSFNIPLLAMGKQKIITQQMAYASLLVVILGVPMVYYKQAIGAAYTMLLGEFAIVIFAVIIYLKEISKGKWQNA